MYLRDTFCDGNGTKLAKIIEKDASYVLRLFYPPQKKGAKGIGPEITEACTAKFDLVRGFWESDPVEWSADYLPLAESQTPDLLAKTPDGKYVRWDIKKPSVQSPTTELAFQWPFGKRITPWQYNRLDLTEKQDVEKYIRLLLKAKDPPAEHQKPAHNEKTGTHA